jgi:drug/metabolite transporter (DMT)-like permease
VSATDRSGSGTPRGRVYALLVLTTILWGAGPVAGKVALAGIPTITLGALRFVLSALILLVAASGRIASWRTLSRQDVGMLLLLGSLGIFVNHLLFFYALGLAPASHASIIAPTTSPIWTILMAVWLAGERVGRSQVVGIALCMGGVVLVVQPTGGTAEAAAVLLGDFLFLLAGLTWGIYSYLCKVALRRMSTESVLAYAMGVGGLALCPLALAERPWVTLPAASVASWAGLLYLAVANTVLAFSWWNLGIQRVGAGRTATFSNLVPVFGVAIAALVLGERLTAVQFAGGGLCLVGVWLCQR